MTSKNVFIRFACLLACCVFHNVVSLGQESIPSADQQSAPRETDSEDDSVRVRDEGETPSNVSDSKKDSSRHRNTVDELETDRAAARTPDNADPLRQLIQKQNSSRRKKSNADSDVIRTDGEIRYSPANELETVIRIRFADPQTVVKSLETIFRGRVNVWAIDRRSIRVRAPANEFEEVKRVVASFDVQDRETSGREISERADREAFAVPTSPAAKSLLERIQVQETAARKEAERLRYQASKSKTDARLEESVERQSKLRSLLHNALDLKLELEELQLNELRSTLNQLERQIGQRRQLRDKIISRRAAELLEHDSLRWNSNGLGEPRERRSVDPSAIKQDVESSVPDISGNWTLEMAPHVHLVIRPTNDRKTSFLVRAMLRPKEGGSQEEGLSQEEDVWQFQWDPTTRRFEGTSLFSSKNNGVVGFTLSADATCQRLDAAIVYDEKQMENYINEQIAMDEKTRGTRDPVTRKQLESNFHYLSHPTWIRSVIDDESESPEEQDTGDIGSVKSPPTDDSNAAAIKSRSGNQPQPPSPEEIQASFEPFANRVATAEEKAKALEAKYFQDRSNANELKSALDALAQAREEFQAKLKQSSENVLARIQIQAQMAESRVAVVEMRVRTLTTRYTSGEASDADLAAAVDSYSEAQENHVYAKARIERYAPVFAQFYQDTDNEGLALMKQAIPSGRDKYDPDVALSWLEAATGLKLEFVRFDDLGLWFKGALRVREGSHRCKAGDLIVVLNQHLFESLDQAVDALLDRNHEGFQSMYLAKGLAGRKHKAHFTAGDWEQFLRPGSPENADIPFEVRVRNGESGMLETEYLRGVCISPDGLVVIPVSPKSLVADEPIVAYEGVKGVARVIGSHEAYGLTLVKLESPDHPLFNWLKCSKGSPAKGQRLTMFVNHNKTLVPEVKEIGQAFPNRDVERDAFVFPCDTEIHIGAALVSLDRELQGIVLDKTQRTAGESNPESSNNYVFAIPALHLQKLIDNYRKSRSPGNPPKVDTF